MKYLLPILALCISASAANVNFTVTSWASVTEPANPYSVTFNEGFCDHSGCTGTGVELDETFQGVAKSLMLDSAPQNQVTNVYYLFQGKMVEWDTQMGGMIIHPESQGFQFNEVRLFWTNPNAWNIIQESFTAVPEPDYIPVMAVMALGLLQKFKGKHVIGVN